MKSRLIAVLVFAWAAVAHANMYFVPDDFIDLQAALDEINSSDTIICRAGTYRGPFYIWARNVTIASEFLLTRDPIFISNCIVRAGNGSPDNRCFETQQANVQDSVRLHLHGLTIQEAHNIGADDRGGGIRLRNRVADFNDCIFKANLAGTGGAVYADSSIVSFKNCFFQSNDAVRQGRCISGYRSEFYLYNCDIGPSGYLIADEHEDSEIDIRVSSVSFQRTRIHDTGRTVEGAVDFISCNNQTGRPDFVRLYNCTVENNAFWTFFESGNSTHPREFVLDSCEIIGNSLPFPLWSPSFSAATANVYVTNTHFENSTTPPNVAGAGLLHVVGGNLRIVVEGNYFIGNYSGQVACIFLRGISSINQGRFQRNFFISNSSWGYPRNRSTSVALDNVGEGVFEYNALLDNIGDAVYTSDYFSPTSYALHNFWGDSTGPYEATRNPGGLGDTTNAATIYDEWLLSEDEIPDTSLFPPPNDAEERCGAIPSTWFISSVYPNPFNSEFRIELDGLTGADFEVRLFDLLGREVALFHSGRTMRGTLSFSAPANLAAGIYFVSAHDHSYSETKKVLYLK